MKFHGLTLLGLGLLTGAVFAQDRAADTSNPEEINEKIELKTVMDKTSYAIGLGIGRNLKPQAAQIDLGVLIRGMADAMAGKTPLLSSEELNEAMMAFQQEVQKREAESRFAANPQLKALAEKNKKEGDAFLAANKAKDGVITLESGLQYTVLQSGNGNSPKETDIVTTHYRGTLIDGTVFDSSIDRGQPAKFPVSGVIAGWTEALTRMKVGDKWRLFIPSDLAYGASPRPGGPIGPNAVLIFELELLSIGN